MPTILAAAGVEPPRNLPGRSLLPLAAGEHPPWREYLFCEWNTSHTLPPPSLLFPQRTVRDGRFKLIVNLMSGRPNPTDRLHVPGPRDDWSHAAGDRRGRRGGSPHVRHVAGSTASRALRPGARPVGTRSTWPTGPSTRHARPPARRGDTVAATDRRSLADAKKLAKFVAECEEQARKTGPNKTETEWRYPDYLYR